MRADLWTILEPIAVDPARKSWKDVLRNLVYHANLQGLAWPSVATIRAETGYKSDRAIVDALAGLEEAQIIRRIPGEGGGGGRGRSTRWLVNTLPEHVDKLSTSRGIVNRDMVKKGEVTSTFPDIVNRDKVKKGEPTSKRENLLPKKGEVTSTRIYKEYRKEVSKSVCVATPGKKMEVTSPFVNNSPKAGKDASAEGCPPPHGSRPRQVCLEGGRAPRQPDVLELFPQLRPDYLGLCSKLGWRPNDPKQTPPADTELARRAIVTCAYREGLSPSEAKKFLRYNAKRKWAAIDQANCVKDLAKEFCEAWKRRDIDAFFAEVDRRRAAAELRRAANAGRP